MQLRSTEHGHSPFEDELRRIKTPVCKAFRKGKKIVPVSFTPRGKLPAKDQIAQAFPKTIAQHRGAVLYAAKPLAKPAPKRVAVLFSGGPAAGGHNVIVGIKQALGNKSTLLGVRNGPGGLLKGDLFEIKDKDVKQLVNTGGFDFLGTDRTKIKTAEQLAQVQAVCVRHRLDAIIIIGGDDSNTNAAVLAEHLFSNIKSDGSGVQVIGVPKTMDGDLQYGKLLPISFGFDTATKIYAESCGNILQDVKSSRKYWHFIRLMGRSASNVALEVALQAKPTIALISEEVAAKRMPLQQIVDSIADAVIMRSAKGMNYGVVIVPEGLLEFIPEMNNLIEEISRILAANASEVASMPKAQRPSYVAAKLGEQNANLYKSLPAYVQEVLAADRDAHGNLTVSQIETEKLLIELVARRVKERSPSTPFAANNHFFGYEGRCGAPTLFDAMFALNLGLCAGSLVLDGRTGYMASFADLDKGGTPVAIPLSGMLTIESRGGKEEMVIQKALTRLDSPAFRHFASRRLEWMRKDCMSSPGPRQLWGPTANQLPLTVALNQGAKGLKFKV